jgi:DeoR/GlpR family transcriptional regulator of sugar metabolism
MGGNTGRNLTYKNTDKDPDDVRRVQEMESNYQTKARRKFSANPAVSLLVDGESVIVDNGTTVTRVQRIGNKIYEVALTEIT